MQSTLKALAALNTVHAWSRSKFISVASSHIDVSRALWCWCCYCCECWRWWFVWCGLELLYSRGEHKADDIAEAISRSVCVCVCVAVHVGGARSMASVRRNVSNHWDDWTQRRESLLVCLCLATFNRQNKFQNAKMTDRHRPIYNLQNRYREDIITDMYIAQ